MESGFFYPFNTPDHISAEERDITLLYRETARFKNYRVNDHGSAIHLNSTYLDVIDRWFAIRGGLMSVSSVGAVLGLGAFTAIDIIPDTTPDLGSILFTAFLVVVFGTVIILMSKHIIRREFFSYTHFPIRFNRKTRMVHVFRHSGPGGVLSVPWDTVHFDLAKGAKDTRLQDVRGYVMDRDTIVDTFAVGNFRLHADETREIWRFICIYMEEGPQALPRHPGICTSTSTSWTNCFVWATRYCVTFFPFPLLEWMLACVRWIVMKSCKEPVWPGGIAAESVIEPGDVHQWPEPAVTGQPTTQDGKLWECSAEGHHKNKN